MTFQHAAPSEVGVDSRAVLGFLAELERRELSLDSLLIYRGGKLALEHYWWPYRADIPHTLHSATKSFVGTAVGFALAEGNIRLEDKLVSFFPEHLPESAGENLRAITIADLLTMRTGHRVGLSGKTWRLLETSWVADFLSRDVDAEPGKAFTYSSASSHMLSAIVQRATGSSVAEYLGPRLFEPLGFSGHSWDTDPEGYCSGGNGLTLRSVDFLKWGVLHLNDGLWNGERILPEGWVAEATFWHVAQANSGSWNGAEFVPAESADEREGYGYQIWLTEHGGYRASGMFGQDVFVFPEHDAVIVTTGSITHGLHRYLSGLVHEYLLPAFEASPSAASDTQLAAALADDNQAPEPRSVDPEPVLANTRFTCEPNDDDLRTIAFTATDGVLTVTLEDTRGSHEIQCGLSTWVESETTVTCWRLHHSYQPERMRVLACAHWREPRVLVLDWYFVESPFHDTVTIEFGASGELRWHHEVNVNSTETDRPMITAHQDQS